ncbi:hypothetical protein Pint_29610 [Pistacia integerrima]|uniref:Uncharacterized protein n=1 Tax=Pistacia integerrima TaxID=434235 RepID=A0ACC0X0G6_9ROSI|nr:hypothetical protein Pint_29610 [Pistacia integerrima]
MAQPSHLSQHIESFVNFSSSPAHQAASLDAVVSLLKNNVLTIEKLVREMDMYLTTTDDVTRARGILLGEVLSNLYFTVNSINLSLQNSVEDFLYGICEAIDGEKDPQCLMLTFCIVESTGEDFDVKRDDLSSALMRIAKHAGAIWSLIKDAIYFSLEPSLFFGLESLDGLGFEDNAILREALTLLQTVIKQNTDLFLSQIIADEEINFIFRSISNFKSYNNIPMESKQKLHAVGCILSVSVKASLASCNRVMESFFPSLVDALGLSVRNSSQDWFPNDNYVLAERLNHAALYLCIELIAACRDVISGSEPFMTESALAHEKWCCLIQSFSASLTKAFTFTSATSTNEDAYDADVYFGGESC